MNLGAAFGKRGAEAGEFKHPNSQEEPPAELGNEFKSFNSSPAAQLLEHPVIVAGSG